jgi:hypothetical protein
MLFVEKTMTSIAHNGYLPGRTEAGGRSTMSRISSVVLVVLSAACVTVGFPVWASQPVVEKRIAVAPGVALHSIEAGRANSKPPIVFIPGWSAGADIWRGQIARFDTYRAISFDPRSQGESSKVTSGNTPEQRAVDLHA